MTAAVTVLGDRIAIAYPIFLAVTVAVVFLLVSKRERRTPHQRYMDDLARANRRLDKATR